MYLLEFHKNAIPSKHQYRQPFPVKVHKMSLSILIKLNHTICPDLVTEAREVWKDGPVSHCWKIARSLL